MMKCTLILFLFFIGLSGWTQTDTTVIPEHLKKYEQLEKVEPVKQGQYVKFKVNGEVENDVLVSLLDHRGVLINSASVNVSQEKGLAFATKNLDPGVYFFKVELLHSTEIKMVEVVE